MIKFLTKLKSQSNIIHVSTKIDPHKHWIVLLRVFSIIVLILIVFSLYLLYQIKNEQIFQFKPISEGQSNLLNENLLKNVTDSFNQKAKKEAELKGKVQSFTDPSL